MESASDFGAWLGALTAQKKILAAACLIFVVELVLRYLAPRSALYARWTAAFAAIGRVWTIVLLSIIYVVSVGPIALIMRVRGTDLLDRKLTPEPTFYRPHEPGPLPPGDAARHQF